MKSYIGKTFLLIVYLLCSFPGYSQNKTIDSLKKVLQTQKEDTGKVNTLYALCDEFRYQRGDYTIALKYALDGLSLSNKIGYNKGRGIAYSQMGWIHIEEKQYSEANKYLDSALNIYREINDKKDIANTCFWIGNNYEYLFLYADALGMLNKSLSLYRELGDRKNMAELYYNIGFCYGNLESYGDASTNEYEALKLFEETGDKVQAANLLSMIGVNYKYLKDDSDALINLQAGLKLLTELNIRADMATSMTELGEVYTTMGDYANALKYDSASLKIFQELRTSAPWGIPLTLSALGQNYQKLGEKADASGDKYEAGKNYDDALTSYQESLKYYEGMKDFNSVAELNNAIGFTQIKLKNFSIAKEYFIKDLQLPANSSNNKNFSDSYLGLSEIDSITGNFKQAYLHYKKYNIYHDSLANGENSKKSLQAKMLYESRKNEEIVKAAEQKRKAEEDADRNLQLTAIALFIPIFFLLVLFLGRIKVKARVVEFLAIVGLLMLFEFITDLVFPYISDLTNDKPVWEMLILVAIAALLEPLNFKFEQWVKVHLVHKRVPAAIPVMVESILNDAGSERTE